MYTRWFVIDPEKYNNLTPRSFGQALYRDEQSIVFVENECPSEIENCCIATELSREEFVELERQTPVYAYVPVRKRAR